MGTLIVVAAAARKAISMFKLVSKIAVTVVSAALLSTGALATAPKPASADTTSTLLIAGAAIGALVLFNDYQHKQQQNNTIVGYTSNGGTIYGDGRIVMPNGQTIYPNQNGQYPTGQYAYYNPNQTATTYRYDYNRSGQYDRTGRHQNNGNGWNGNGNNNGNFNNRNNRNGNMNRGNGRG